MNLPRSLPVRFIRADETRERNGGRVSEQKGYVRDPPDVLFAVRGAEAEIAVEPEPDVVAVQAVGVEVSLQQGLLQSIGDGGFAGGGEPGEPQRETFLLV